MQISFYSFPDEQPQCNHLFSLIESNEFQFVSCIIDMLSNLESVTNDNTVDVFFFFFTNQSLNHKWHVHVKPEGGDTYAAMGERCKSLGGHYNPYEVDLEVSI